MILTLTLTLTLIRSLALALALALALTLALTLTLTRRAASRSGRPSTAATPRSGLTWGRAATRLVTATS